MQRHVLNEPRMGRERFMLRPRTEIPQGPKGGNPIVPKTNVFGTAEISTKVRRKAPTSVVWLRADPAAAKLTYNAQTADLKVVGERLTTPVTNPFIRFLVGKPIQAY